MKITSRFALLWLKATILLAAIAVSVAFYFPALGQAQTAHATAKNPKLSTPLVLLSSKVVQATTRTPLAEAVRPPSNFSRAALPKSLQDAIHAGQMHVTDQGAVQVYIELDSITSQNLQALRDHGVTVQIIGEPKPDKSKGEVPTKIPTVQGLLPITMISQVSSLNFVRYIRLPDYGIRNTGSVESQGDAILQAETARSQFGVDGTGIRVGVISDGIGGIFTNGCTSCGPASTLPSPISTGDLPSATGSRNSSGILTSVSGGIIAQSFRADQNLEACNGVCDTSGLVGAEGTAMLEIVHDLAPGAQLYFANFDTGMSFMQAVNYLSANTDVSVDDIGFTLPPFDGTDAISTNTATALNASSNSIRGYFTAVDNFAQDHYEGQYLASANDGTSITGQAGNLHVFQAVSGVTVDNQIFGPSIADPATIIPSGTISVVLTWNDPENSSPNDYDLFLVPLNCSGFSSTNRLPLPPCTISGAPLASSVNPQTGTQPPLEALSYRNPSASSNLAVGIVIQNANNTAQPCTLDMFIEGSLGDGSIPDHNFNTESGSVLAEGDAGGSPVSVVSVGALDQMQCTSSGNCTGSVEPYSDQGPTEATPQAATRMKPDVTATDDVAVTGAGGFGINGPNGENTGGCASGQTPCYFAGTSAAAPHVAAIAALTLQAAPCLLSSSSVNQAAIARAQLRNFITGTAVSLPGISQSVPNNIEGYGVVNALAAIGATLPVVNAGSDQVVSAAGANGATVTLNGSASDPDSCPLTLKWSGPCSTASMGNANVTCPIGNNTETLTASNGGVSTSLPTSTTQITVSDFTLAGQQPAQSVQPGQSASYTISVGEQYGIFTNPVALSCSGLPASASCSFSYASVTPGNGFNGSVNSTLTIATAASSSLLPPRDWNIPNPRFVIWIVALLALMTITLIVRKTERKRLFSGAFCVLAICLVLPIVSCGGAVNNGSQGPSHTGTPAGTYTVTITGASNQLQHSTPVTLTVQ